MKQIKDIEKLRKLAKEKVINCRIDVSVSHFGRLNVQKQIRYNSDEFKEWSVFNPSKGIFEHFREDELIEDTCIIQAMNKGGLFLEEDG